ncbi:GntR family transcriptional regulator [Rhizobium leguminosarum]|uniref:GntR family transcriptional regulator n=1 Tax=Rhizobium leguminosarum TaxID=384 RepID=UPI001C9374FA|nr:GntR family transcriptional regulator [Rhizobium leguminosarum]MBY5720934.1 GntR family transcriptional regulator [Rhizobium leguminosarum]
MDMSALKINTFNSLPRSDADTIRQYLQIQTLRKRPKSSAPSLVYDRVKTVVLDSLLPVGTRLEPGAIAKLVGFGLTPSREALIRLAAERIIAFVPGNGFFLPLPDLRETLALFEFGLGLLTHCVHLFQSPLDSLHDYQAAAQMEESTPDIAAEIVEQFHLSLATHSENVVVVETMTNFLARTRRIRVEELRDPTAREFQKGLIREVSKHLASLQIEDALRLLENDHRRRKASTVRTIQTMVSSSLL